jgi:hypothetical protein
MFDKKVDWLVADFPGEDDDLIYELTLAPVEPDCVEECQPIPEYLDEMTPGPFLAAILSSVDPTRLTGANAVTVMRAFHRMGSHCQAGEYETMFEVAHAADPDTSYRYRTVNDYAPEEIGAALSYTRRMTDSELGVALDVTIRLPRVREALASGDIDGPKARVLTMDTAHLEPANAREVVDRIIDEVSDLTTGQLRARLRRLCIEADPEDAKSRYELLVSERKVVAEENPEGTAALIISPCSPEDVYAITWPSTTGDGDTARPAAPASNGSAHSGTPTAPGDHPEWSRAPAGEATGLRSTRPCSGRARTPCRSSNPR